MMHGQQNVKCRKRLSSVPLLSWIYHPCSECWHKFYLSEIFPWIRPPPAVICFEQRFHITSFFPVHNRFVSYIIGGTFLWNSRCHLLKDEFWACDSLTNAGCFTCWPSCGLQSTKKKTGPVQSCGCDWPRHWCCRQTIFAGLFYIHVRSVVI